MENRQVLKKSLIIGLTCVVTYVSSYYLRNLLGVLTPAMLETGDYTKEYVGLLSSVYMILYATGQFTNGLLGDRFSSKLMIVTGICISGTASLVFPLTQYAALQTVCFGFLGYGLSMLRGPLTKIIAENTPSGHARLICAFFSASAFIGSFIAGVFAAVFRWNTAFIAAGISFYVIAAAAFVILTILERKGMILNSYSKGEKPSEIFGVFKADGFVFFLIISMLNEVAATSISFWIPTYLTEYLVLDINVANAVFVIKSIIRMFSPFAAIFIYKYVNDPVRIIKYAFLVSIFPFAGMLFVKNALFNVILLILALFIEGLAGGVVWSIYIPSLKSTGKVASANGIIDCSGYVLAAIANVIFAQTAGSLGWHSVIIIWASVMLAAYLISAAKHLQTKKAAKN